MSSLHSCRWGWCRFTTVLHGNFVEHVISTHINKAEPVKRADIDLIRQVDQGDDASGHSGDSFAGGISNLTTELTSRSEAHQLSFTSGSVLVLPLSQQKQQATPSDGGTQAGGWNQVSSQFNLQSQALYKSQSFDYRMTESQAV